MFPEYLSQWSVTAASHVHLSGVKIAKTTLTWDFHGFVITSHTDCCQWVPGGLVITKTWWCKHNPWMVSFPDLESCLFHFADFINISCCIFHFISSSTAPIVETLLEVLFYCWDCLNNTSIVVSTIIWLYSTLPQQPRGANWSRS